MRSIIMLVTLAGRRLAADGVPFIDSRYARRLLLLSATLTAAMVVGLLAYAPSARADVACDPSLPNFCAEKTATPDPVKVGEPLTFTIRGYCTPDLINCGRFGSAGMTDTLPEGLDFDSASATGFSGPEFANPPQPTCTFSESDRTVTCAPLAFWFDLPSGTAVPFVATIEVIPRECGTFTNTANVARQLVSETFTVVGCPDTTPPTVTTSTPTNKADSVTATFDEDVQNVTPSTFILERRIAAKVKTDPPKYVLVDATVELKDGRYVLDPVQDLPKGNYRATITTDVTDVAGNALEEDVVWTFKVEK